MEAIGLPDLPIDVMAALRTTPLILRQLVELSRGLSGRIYLRFARPALFRAEMEKLLPCDSFIRVQGAGAGGLMLVFQSAKDRTLEKSQTPGDIANSDEVG